MENKQEFEKYPELAASIEWFANNVPCPGSPWNELLRQINAALYRPVPVDVEQAAEGIWKQHHDRYQNNLKECSGKDNFPKLGTYIIDAIKAAYLAGASRPTFNPESFLKELREGNPYVDKGGLHGSMWKDLCNKAAELLKTKEEK